MARQLIAVRGTVTCHIIHAMPLLTKTQRAKRLPMMNHCQLIAKCQVSAKSQKMQDARCKMNDYA
jgi:hypothetical protein